MNKKEFLITEGYTQDFFGSLSLNGCYLFSLINAGNKLSTVKISVFDALKKAIVSHGLYINMDDYNDFKNFYVTDARQLLQDIFGGVWNVEKKQEVEQLSKNQTVITEYLRELPEGIITQHFVGVDYDPKKNSYTKKYGKLVSVRIVTKV